MHENRALAKPLVDQLGLGKILNRSGFVQCYFVSI